MPVDGSDKLSYVSFSHTQAFSLVQYITQAQGRRMYWLFLLHSHLHEKEQSNEN